MAVAFEHRMSRAGDPNLHTHVLVKMRLKDRTAAGRRWTATGCTPN